MMGSDVILNLTDALAVSRGLWIPKNTDVCVLSMVAPRSNSPTKFESLTKTDADQIDNFFDDDSDGFVQKQNLQSLQSLSENPRSILFN